MSTEFYEELWETVSEKREIFSGEIENSRKNGKKYTAQASIAPVLNVMNEVVFYVGIERDVSKEKEIDKAKTEFVSLASHQLRTPLTSISWYTEMLMAGDAGTLTSDQSEFLNEIKNGNQGMIELVNDLLDVSRLELGTFIIEPEQTDIGELIDKVLGILKPGISKKELKILREYEKGFPKMEVDPKLMKIVFQNLLSNAVKYTPKQGEIKVVFKKKNKSEVIFEIADSGLGIPKDQKDKIFTKLFRADNVKEAGKEGTGLGLYLVKYIIENSKGKIWFDSEENKGTTFFIQLPLSGMKARSGTRSLEGKKGGSYGIDDNA